MSQDHVVLRTADRAEARERFPHHDVMVVASRDDVPAVVLTAHAGRSVAVVVVPAVGDAEELRELVTAELRRVTPDAKVSIDDEGGGHAVQPVVSEQSRQVLRLLADGLTVAQAARRLGLSARTCTRRIQEAREALGVDSTAEAIAVLTPGPAPQAEAVVLVGRDTALRRIQELLRRDAPVVLVGEAAVGKTALLTATARVDGRKVLHGGGQESLRWKEFWAVAQAAGTGETHADVEGVTRQVEGAVGPNLLVVDDVHLFDESSVAVLEALAGRISILAAARPDPPIGAPGEAFGPVARLAQAGFTVEVVETLSDDDVRRLARILDPDLPEDAAAAVASAAGGLPLLVEFLCRGDRSAVVGHGLVPAIQGLSAAERASAVRLAVTDMLLPADGMTPSLVDAGVATHTAAGVRIRHALVGEAVVAACPPELLTLTHASLSVENERAGRAASAARHAQAAGDSTRATTLALTAASEATSPSDRAHLLALAARACEGERRTELLVRAVAALSAVGGHREVLALTAESIVDEPAAAAALDLGRARALWHQGESDGAVTAARLGLSRVSGAGTAVEAGLITEAVRCELLSIGAQPDHGELLDRADSLTAELGQGRAALLAVAGLSAYFVDGTGSAQWDEGRRVARTEGDVDALMRCTNNLVSWHEAGGDQQLARELAESGAVEAASAGLLQWQAQFQALAANLQFHAGQYPKALATLDDVDATVVDEQTRLQARQTRLAVLIDLGLLDAARPLLPDLEGDAANDWLRDNTGLYLAAAHAFWSGDLRSALRLAQPLLEADDVYVVAWFTRPLAAWAQLDLGEPVSVPQGEAPFPLVAGLAREAFALSRLAQDPAQARDAFDEAAALGHAWSYAPSLRAAWGAAEAARRCGDPDAVDRLLSVEKLATEAGLEPLLARVQRSLRLAGVRRAARRAPDRSGLLTERERLVLDLIAQGATDMEIARRLGIGRSTVRRLLEGARGKLGTTGRFASVAAVRRQHP